MRKKINLALVGSNFALRGYLPVIEDNNNLNLKILCSRNVKKIKLANKYKKLELENDWKKIFKRSIDLIVLAVPPKVQEKILKFNLKYKKMIILEKPISTNYLKSKKLIDLFKKKKIKAEINLTFLNHPNFIYLRKIIKNQKFGKVLNYYINWNFVSYDYNVKKKSWKVQQKLGGGITNIFLTHVLSYCEFLFGKNLIYNMNTSTDHFKKINFIKKIKCEVKNPNNVNGNIILQFKKTGNQNHLFKEKKIKADINLTFLNHPNFIYLMKIIKNKKFGKVLNYSINWNFVIYDYNIKKKSWKVQQKLGGGITNIFLTHVLSYCEFLFGKNLIYNVNTSIDHFKKIKFLKKINCEVKNPNNIAGNIILQVKKAGKQNHIFKINFEKCSVIIENNSKDWTKNFRMKINNKLIKFKKSNKYNDGRCDQIESLINQFLRRKNYKKINYCLNSEKIINQIKY